jgi:acyl dehydratase
MTDPSFPFPAIGLVHIRNRITQRRPIEARERLSFEVRATPLEPHPRGRQFSLLTSAFANGEPVWEEVSTNLRRASSPASSSSSPPSEDEEASPNGTPSVKELPIAGTWSLPGDLGRRYGAVSGDLNPIHVHALTARLFGFPTAIAHGMWTHARCLAALEPRLPDTFVVEVAFKRPILLPAKVEFLESQMKDSISFGVRDARKGTPHLEGALSFTG